MNEGIFCRALSAVSFRSPKHAAKMAALRPGAKAGGKQDTRLHRASVFHPFPLSPPPERGRTCSVLPEDGRAFALKVQDSGALPYP